MPSPTYGFVGTDWGAVAGSLRRLHRMSLDTREAMAPYCGGLRNRGDALHDALHDLAHRLGAPPDLLRGCVHDEIADPSRAPGCPADLHPTRAPANLP